MRPPSPATFSTRDRAFAQRRGLGDAARDAHACRPAARRRAAATSVAVPPPCVTRTRSPAARPSFASVAALKRAVRDALPSAVFCSGGERRTMGSLAVDREFGDALERRARRAQLAGRTSATDVVEPRASPTPAGPARSACARLPACRGGNPAMLEHRAQHAQHLPAGTRSPCGFTDRVERLHAAFHVHERAAGLGERRDRQDHVRVVGRGVAISREHHGEFRIARARRAPAGPCRARPPRPRTR